MKRLRLKNDSVNNKIKDMFSLIQNKDFNSLRSIKMLLKKMND